MNRRFTIIYADPPWDYRDKANAGKRGASHKYPCMKLEDLMMLPVREIASENCLLAMWWVAPMPSEALALVKAWGFTLKTMFGFLWHKETKNGCSHFGMGNLTRANPEACLFATLGKPKRVDAGVRAFMSEKTREHSRKPDAARDRLVRLMGDVPRVELFARQRHEGWSCWGDEVDGDRIFEATP